MTVVPEVIDLEAQLHSRQPSRLVAFNGVSLSMLPVERKQVHPGDLSIIVSDLSDVR